MPQGAPRVPSHAARALRRINGWQRATSEPSPVVEPGDSLSEDDAKAPTLGVSSATYQCFTHAVDHLHAVPALLFEAEVVHTYAPYSLLRAAVEAAGKATWLLEPKSEYAAASSEPTTTSARARSSCIGRRL
ncbi:hypothetical protein SUDANB15_00234 [Streptomyces sp. enrichment culture]